MSEDNQDKKYEFESAEEVPDYMQGYVDKNLIKKAELKDEKKKPLLVKIFSALLNIITLGFYGRSKRKQKLDGVYDNDNELGLKDELDKIGDSINSSNEEKEMITKEEADAAQKATDFDNSSNSHKTEDVKETDINSEEEQKEM